MTSRAWKVCGGGGGKFGSRSCNKLTRPSVAQHSVASTVHTNVGSAEDRKDRWAGPGDTTYREKPETGRPGCLIWMVGHVSLCWNTIPYPRKMYCVLLRNNFYNFKWKIPWSKVLPLKRNIPKYHSTWYWTYKLTANTSPFLHVPFFITKFCEFYVTILSQSPMNAFSFPFLFLPLFCFEEEVEGRGRSNHRFSKLRNATG